MPLSGPKDLLATDRWALAQGDSDAGPSVLRFRQPVLGVGQTSGYPKCLRIVWGYAEEGSGLMPQGDTDSELTAFEDVAVAALEDGALAVLTAVLTFDGARQWIFYTGDVRACAARLNALPPTAAPYPIELDAFDDPDWAYLRDQIVGPLQSDT